MDDTIPARRAPEPDVDPRDRAMARLRQGLVPYDRDLAEFTYEELTGLEERFQIVKLRPACGDTKFDDESSRSF